MNSLLVILALLFLGWFWLDSLRAREIATGICRAVCERHGLQFLDQTVSLRHLRLRRTDTGLRILRMYVFDFSTEGIGRYGGYIVLIGLDPDEINIKVP